MRNGHAPTLTIGHIKSCNDNHARATTEREAPKSLPPMAAQQPRLTTLHPAPLTNKDTNTTELLPAIHRRRAVTTAALALFGAICNRNGTPHSAAQPLPVTQNPCKGVPGKRRISVPRDTARPLLPLNRCRDRNRKVAPLLNWQLSCSDTMQ